MLQDVVSPPPSLFMRDLDMYMSHVETASGEVMLQFLKYAGFPAMQWYAPPDIAQHRTFNYALLLSHQRHTHGSLGTCTSS